METIPIHLLQSFVTFNEASNISTAANSLGITQPALSKQLKALELLLPHAVFTFSGRKKVLTPFGQSLHLQLMERIGNIQETIDDVSTRYTDPGLAHLRISARLGILDRLSEKISFSGCLSFNESTNDQVIADLLSRKAEIGIAHSLPSSHELIARPLFKEEFQIVISKGLLPIRKNYGKSLFQELKRLPCIDFKKHDIIIRTVCAANGIDSKALKVSRITANYVRIAKLVEANLGWAIVPSYLEMDQNIVWTIKIPSDVITLRKFSIAYRSEFTGIPWIKEVINQIVESFKSAANS